MFRRRQPTVADSGPADSAPADSAPADTTVPMQAGSQAGTSPGAGTTPGHAETAGKGRPTPKRSEAQRRRQPYTAPKDRKEANQRYRQRERETRNRRLIAMQSGEQWALPTRDRGPVKALARDYVDSRRRLSEFYMYGLIVLLGLLFVRNALVQTIVPAVTMGAILIMLGEGVFIGYRVRALAQERLPGESTHGVRLYAAMRALQIRRLRVPKPRVRPGDSF